MDELKWVNHLKLDPIRPLLESQNEAVVYFTLKDLLAQDPGPAEKIWNLPETLKIIKKQNSNGFWPCTKKDKNTRQNAHLTETWRQLRYLVDQYEITKDHPAVQRACGYVFSCQSEEGDFRGILANQYAPYYTGALLYLLIKAGYAQDPRVTKGIECLLGMRQNDGGWVIGSPGMVNLSWKEVIALTSVWTETAERDFDRTKPFSAAGTGMALRALAVHPLYRRSQEAMKAAALLKTKFLKEDNTSSYRHPDNWVRFQFPYWWNHLISALDMVSLIGYTAKDADVQRALNWFIAHQEESGLWKVSYSAIHKHNNNEKTKQLQLWVTLAICRLFKRLYMG